MLDVAEDLHHITWVVADLDATLATFRSLPGGGAVIREALPGRGVATARIRCGSTWLVFVQPLGPGPPADRLAAAGEGPMLVSLRVDDLDAALSRLAADGIGPAGKKRAGVGGWQVIDLDLTLPGGLTLQLCEDRSSR